VGSDGGRIHAVKFIVVPALSRQDKLARAAKFGIISDHGDFGDDGDVGDLLTRRQLRVPHHPSYTKAHPGGSSSVVQT
jgi:hypothetical protein